MRLKGKCGIITAAASGMGRAGALLFASEGAAVCVVDRDEQAARKVAGEILEAGGRAHAIAADLRSDEASQSIVSDAKAALGAIDFVWNHLGDPGPSAVEGIDMKYWDQAVDLNLRSQFLTTIAAIPEMRSRGAGSVLFTASTSGLVASAYSPVYSGMKAGVIGLMRGLAKRYAKEGIRINAICPGPIDTPMLRTFVNRPDGLDKGKDVELLAKQFGTTTALGRAGRPEEVAAAALFLLSDDASFITGVALPVDGGLIA